MQQGMDFLQAQVSNAAMQHQTLLQNLEDHATQAEDQRYRELCSRYIPQMRQHQQALESYRAVIGEPAGGTAKKVVGAVVGMGRDAVDAVRGSDFLRIVGDIVTIRQSQDTFATFAAVGERIGQPQLAEIGRTGEQHHDRMQRDFNALAQQFFAEHASGMAT